MAEAAITEPNQALSVERVFRALANSTRVRILHLLTATRPGHSRRAARI